MLSLTKTGLPIATAFRPACSTFQNPVGEIEKVVQSCTVFAIGGNIFKAKTKVTLHNCEIDRS